MPKFLVPNVMAEKVYSYRTNDNRLLKVWAEDGVVLIEDQSDGKFHSFSQKDTRDRFRALFEAADGMVREATGSADQGDKWQKEEGNKALQLVACLRKALADAKAQGDPTDVEVQRIMSRERKKTSLWVPNQSVLKAGGAFLFPPGKK